MDSRSIYIRLCEKGKTLKETYGPGSGLHKHHIIPKHSGGTDEEENFTYLTPREHKIAHYLLWRINKNPNDLRSMHMLGVELSVTQRRIVGKFCHENKIGFHGASSEDLKKWRQIGLETQKKSGSKQTWYYWSTPEGRKERSSMGGKAAAPIQIKNKIGLFTDDKEKRKEWAILGGKAMTGMKCVTNGKHRTRIRPEKLDEYLSKGYRLGFTLD